MPADRALHPPVHPVREAVDMEAVVAWCSHSPDRIFSFLKVRLSRNCCDIGFFSKIE